MQKKRYSSLVALSLAVISVFSLLAACSNTEKEAPKVKLENVYAMETFPLPEGVERADSFSFANDQVYFTTSSYVEEVGNTTYLYRMNMDGSNPKIVFEYLESGGGETEEGVYSSSYINGIYVDRQGAIWVGEYSYYEDYRDADNPIYENNFTLTQYDEDGNEQTTLDLASLAPDGGDIYVSQLLFDADDSIVISTGNELYFVDGQTHTLQFTVEDEDAWFQQIGLAADGSVVVSTYSYEKGGYVVLPVDKGAKSWGEAIVLQSSTNIRDLIPGSGEYFIYYRDQEGIFGFNKATGEFKEILNWIDSDINANYINSVTMLADEQFACATYSYEDNQANFAILSKKPASEIKETIVLTYACIYLNNDIREKIIAFNKSQGEYRITAKAYDMYNNDENNWQGGAEQLNYDIISGNIPDIINLNGLNANTYISKGLLTDLYKLIDADETVSREDYFQNILDAGSKDGKLYQFMPTFNIYTLAAKTSLVGTEPGWTMEDLNALLRAHPDSRAFTEMTRQNILATSARLAMDSFINLETGLCDFNSEGFIQLLEFAGSFPEEIDWESNYGDNWEEYYKMYESQYKDNLTLLLEVYCYDLRAARNAREQFGEDITFIGFPTSNKNGSAISSYQSFAVSEKSPSKQVCWDFIKQMAPGEVKIDNPYYYGELSINRKAMEQIMAFEMTPMNERPGADQYSFGGRVVYSTRSSIDIAVEADSNDEMDDYYKNYHLTQAEVDQVMELITSVNQLTYQDQNVLNIIEEEVGAYFDGSKSATATAEIIQSRVQIYVSENQ